jgi:hypothetical protein
VAATMSTRHGRRLLIFIIQSKTLSKKSIISRPKRPKTSGG